MKKTTWCLLAGYIVGSFFGVSQLFGVVKGVAGGGSSAAG